MFKRAEKKRKRWEELEELGLDEETMGLNDTDTDESDSDSDGTIGEDDGAQDEGVDEDPISVAEVLKDPIYLVSLNPAVYGCVLCKRKLIKNAGMATAHKSANTHKRRFEEFRVLCADADPRSNAWELGLSNRALKRLGKQAAIREKRKRHKEHKSKAAAKKDFSADSEKTHAILNSQSSPVSQIQPGRVQKNRKLESKTIIETPDVTEASFPHTKKSLSKPRRKNTKKSVQSR